MFFQFAYFQCLVPNITLWMRLRGINSLSKWLDILLTRFDWNNDIANQCKRKILEFVEISMKVCERKGEHEAWLCCGTDREFMRNWPTMMKLWQWIVVIYARTTICECGFSKHNWVKSDH